MSKKKARNLLFLIVPLLLLAGVIVMQTRTAVAHDSNAITYEITGRNGRLIRKVMGDVTDDVRGVPASPVDSFIWNGDGITAINGRVRVEIDPVANTGEIVATWRDVNGRWEYRQNTFVAPPHSTGLQVGPGASDTQLIFDDPVTTNVYLHGDTTAGAPILPTIFNLLATWGPAEVTLNGQPFENPYDGPTPNWGGHTMTTVGARNEDGQVLTLDGDIYNPSQAANGVVYDDQLEFHLVFEDAPGPEMTDNIPPPLSFFYHVTFQDIKVEITGAE
jgi:hypothetical protein